MGTLTIEFQPNKKLSKNGLRKAHWRESQPLIKALRKSIAEDAYVLGLVEQWETPAKCTVAVRQYYCGRAYDWDGLATLTGPVSDGLVDAGVIPVDDGPDYVVSYSMTAERVDHRHESKVSVTVTPVSE